MLYGKLVARIAEMTGVAPEEVRAVLRAFPDVIMECFEGEQVKTHLGIFRIVRRKEKRVRLPTGEWTTAEERVQARLRPGKRLQRQPTKPSEDLSIQPDQEDPDLKA